MSKEISKAFRKEIREFLKECDCNMNRLHSKCVDNGYAGLAAFMRNVHGSISIDHEPIVRAAMATLRGQQ